MYSDIFCKVYNEFGWNYYPEAFGEQLLLWMEQTGAKVRSSMDLACGTGVLCEILHGQGIEAGGMDFSEGMIAIARQRNSEIAYDVADMVKYRPERNFDLVTCTGDAVNHILDIRDVEQIFRNVYGYLNTDGWFVFDLLNEHEVSDSEPFEMDYSETVRVWFQMTRPAHNKVRLIIRVFENDVLSFEETIQETIHDPAVVCDLLRRCGFREVICSDRLLPDSANPSTTWYITARK